MVLIAIDKHSRRILGYLCKNDENVAYCCSECDFEFTSALDLENHISLKSSPIPNDTDTASEGDIPLNILNDIEREKRLKQKYQVTMRSFCNYYKLFLFVFIINLRLHHAVFSCFDSMMMMMISK